MKALAAATLLLLATLPALAQDRGQEAERARIKHERDVAQDRFMAEEKACRTHFAVNDCISKAKRTRDDALAELRRQEVALNDADRKRREEERQRAYDEKFTPEKQQQEADRRAKALEDSARRQKEFDENAAKRATQEADRAAHPRAPKEAKGTPAPQGTPHTANPATPQPDAARIAENREKYEQRQKEAAEHRKAVEERNAKRTKPAASALPPPPN